MKTKLILILTVLLAGCNLAIAQSPYATRLPAELQTAQMDSLADVTWLQGTTPAIRVEHKELADRVRAVRHLIQQRKEPEVQWDDLLTEMDKVVMADLEKDNQQST